MNLDLKNRLFGAGNRILTAVGAVAGFLVAMGQYLDLVPPEFRTSKLYVVAAALVALGAALRMPSKKEDAAKVATGLALFLALGFTAPAFAHGPYTPEEEATLNADIAKLEAQYAALDPTTGTVDGATVASAVAENAPDPRWSFHLGKITVSPSASFSPTVLSLKDFSISIGPNVGAGLDWVWTNGYGAATHVTLRETSVGMKPLGSLYGIFPFLAQYKIRPGVSYQIGGGSESWKDAFIVGVSLSDNFGFAAR